jgi:hypothetical protein
MVILLSIWLVALLITAQASRTMKSGRASLRSMMTKSAVSVACSLSVGLSGVFAAPLEEKLVNAQPAELETIVTGDIEERQALITADFTRSIYSEEATFKDEIDTYPIDKYVQGTKALFVPEKSHVDLLGEVKADKDLITFKFQEVLCFNIPVIQPRVSLSGYVELFRDKKDGLITRSVEHWDQPVKDVLKTATFF